MYFRRSFFYPALKRILFVLLPVMLLMMLLIQPASAVEIPGTGSAAFIQTSGPNTALNIGDYYTSIAGEPVAGLRHHDVNVYVPCAWPVPTPITFALYDPEVHLPNPVAPSAVDEVRGAEDSTTFSMTAPGGATVGPVTFAPLDGTNGLWVELATVNIANAGYGCGTYIITTTTSDNDDNAWRLQVKNDPDCTVSPGTCSGIGAAQSALLDNANGTDNPDGAAGTGDEILIGLTRISYQHAAASCQDFYFYVDGLTSPIQINNFDMDDPTGAVAADRITYFPPAGSQYAPSVIGTESGASSWNGSPTNPGNTPNPPRTGDSFVIAAADVGWWRANLCITASNQYIFEGVQTQPVFLQKPLFPKMTIAKDDGLTTVAAGGQNVTYTITYANTGDGAAIGTVITDNLPPGATFVSCTGGCAGVGPVTWNLGIVPAPPTAGNTGSVTLTVALPAAAGGTTFTNTVSIDYTDLLGNKYPPETDTDVDTVVGGPSADLSITKDDGQLNYTPGNPLTYTIVVSNNGPDPVTNATVTDNFPAALTSPTWTCAPSAGSTCTAGPVAGNIADTVNVLVGGTLTYTVNTVVSASATGNLTNTASVALPAGFTDPTPGNNTASDTDTPPGSAAPGTGTANGIVLIDPSITKTVQPPFALPGEPVTYTIIITNPGSAPYTGVVVTDNMPPQIEILSVNSTSGNVSFSGQTVNFSQAVLGASVTITVNARVRPNVAVPYLLTNQACMKTDQHATQLCAQALVSSVSHLPNTGESPLTALRIPALVGLVLLFTAGTLIWRRRRQL